MPLRSSDPPANGSKRLDHLATLAGQIGSVLGACEALLPRDSYLAGLRGETTGGATADRRDGVDEQLARLALEQPLWDPIQLANALRRQGWGLRPAAVQARLRRAGLHRAEARLTAVVEVGARAGLALDAERVRSLQRELAQRQLQQAVTEGRGGACVQDSYAVGKLQRVGPVYQQTFIDLATGEAWAKLYPEKRARVAVDLLEERVLSSYRQRGVALRRVFTDRGTEFCGDLDEHLYERCLRHLDVEHRWLQHKNPQHNPHCQRLHQRIHTELFAPRLLADEPETIYDLQRDLDRWLVAYNRAPTRRGS